MMNQIEIKQKFMADDEVLISQLKNYGIAYSLNQFSQSLGLCKSHIAATKKQNRPLNCRTLLLISEQLRKIASQRQTVDAFLLIDLAGTCHELARQRAMG